LSSASDESSKRTFHASKNSFDMESGLFLQVPKLSESDDRETRENYNEDTDLLNETDINRNHSTQRFCPVRRPPSCAQLDCDEEMPIYWTYL
uniref:Ovule protein n=1 Tax=Toxocara canis TaxID=6265 RepID=A0A183U3H1_TOXCA